MRKISIIRPKAACGMAVKYTVILDDKQKVGVMKNDSRIDLELDENDHKILFKVAGLLGIGNGRMSNTLMIPAGTENYNFQGEIVENAGIMFRCIDGEVMRTDNASKAYVGCMITQKLLDPQFLARISETSREGRFKNYIFITLGDDDWSMRVVVGSGVPIMDEIICREAYLQDPGIGAGKLNKIYKIPFCPNQRKQTLEMLMSEYVSKIPGYIREGKDSIRFVGPKEQESAKEPNAEDNKLKKTIEANAYKNNIFLKMAVFEYYRTSESKDFITVLFTLSKLVAENGQAPTPMVDVNHVLGTLDQSGLKKGDKITLGQDMRLKIDTMKDGNGKLWIPLFTDQEELHKGKTANIIINMSIQSLLENGYYRDDVEGVVINPFGQALRIPKEMLNIALKGTASLKKNTSDTSASQEKPVKKTQPGQYDLAYILSRQDEKNQHKVGDVKVYHDVSLKKWRLMVQLDEGGLYFLSVFIKEDGTFDKYCLDYEAAHDSHYEFTDDTAIRKKLYEPGDESKYLHEILIRYVAKNGTSGLTDLIGLSITAQFHYD